MIQELEKKIECLQHEIERIQEEDSQLLPTKKMIESIQEQKQKLLDNYYDKMTAWDKVYLSRHPQRFKVKDWVDALFDDVFYLHGDRLYGEDATMLGALAYFDGIPVTVIGTNKGEDLEENIRYNFGMSHPEGYRKSLRLMKQAEKFGRPIVTIVDTPGAYAGMGAEERGQGEAIARNLFYMSDLKVPIIALMTGEGGSGGALALALADKIIMLENATFSILSPEGFASILWKDGKRARDAAEKMKMTADDLYHEGLIDEVIREGICFQKQDFERVVPDLKKVLKRYLEQEMNKSSQQRIIDRYGKYRKIGQSGRK